ncbi:PXA domain-containing protein [Mrakia frigida]|uniref:PXA domain-containing protein n=1 Tax=Mrakia frigida TaxID=29902 RepID=UPI003FCC10B6
MGRAHPHSLLQRSTLRERERESAIMLRGPSSLKSTTLSSSSLPPTGLPSTPSEPRHLVRKLLFPHLDQRAPIPGIWKSTDKDVVELNDEVYLFIALALRAFVQPWYTKITPRDKTFLPRINSILIHLLQTLTPRVLPPSSRPSQPSPLLPLLLLHLPILLVHHVKSYHLATCLPLPRPVSTVATFEAVQPHVGVLPRGGIDPLYLAQVVEGLMRLALEEEDWESELERAVVREVVSRLVLGGVLSKVGEGSFWWGVGLSLCGIRKEREGDGEALIEEKERRPSSPLPPRSLSPLIDQPRYHRLSPTPFLLSLLNFLQTLLTLSILFLSHLSKLRQLVLSSPPAPYPNVLEPWIDLFGELFQIEGGERGLGGKIVWWWVRGAARVVGRAGGDRLIPHLVTSALTPKTTTYILRKIRIIMFPKGFPVPSPPDPSLEEALEMRATLEDLLLMKFPSPLKPLLLGSSSSQSQTVSGMLDPFADAQINAHLLINILDAVVGTILPELLVGGEVGGGLGSKESG